MTDKLHVNSPFAEFYALVRELRYPRQGTEAWEMPAMEAVADLIERNIKLSEKWRTGEPPDGVDEILIWMRYFMSDKEGAQIARRLGSTPPTGWCTRDGVVFHWQEYMRWLPIVPPVGESEMEAVEGVEATAEAKAELPKSGYEQRIANEADATMMALLAVERDGKDAWVYHETRQRQAARGMRPTIKPFCKYCGSYDVRGFGGACPKCLEDLGP